MIFTGLNLASQRGYQGYQVQENSYRLYVARLTANHQKVTFWLNRGYQSNLLEKRKGYFSKIKNPYKSTR